jgi:hypothetical protein
MLYELETKKDAFTGDSLLQSELNEISVMLCGSIWLDLVGGEVTNVIISAIKDAIAAKAVGEIGISAGEKAGVDGGKTALEEQLKINVKKAREDLDLRTKAAIEKIKY